MIRLSRKSDYGLVALKALRALQPGDAMSARELSLQLDLPTDMTPKVLAKLAQAGLIESLMGKTGGYRLARLAEDISVAEVVRVLDGEPGLAPCREGILECHRIETCDIKHPLDNLHREVMLVLSRMSIAQL
ncbi:MAG: Rrf2 family transcriptional regulator [Myxococcales bacterium]|nr:Rrf2 family transcriptional regulator [Myxococcales bacterium]